MTASVAPEPAAGAASPRPALLEVLPVVLALAGFAVLFARPAALLAGDWWNDPEAGHGLLLAPVAVWLAWRQGLRKDRTPAPALGLLALTLAILLRVASELAAELFTMRASMMLALVGLVVFWWGWRQALSWWLPILLLGLSIPIPEVVLSTIAMPLQLQASEMGAALLAWRNVPVELAGNVILLPGHKLFVTEACSGLRSLTALISLAVLMGGLWLHSLPGRLILLPAAIMIAILINGVRVFLTGFLVYFVDPKLGDGFMHLTEGWLLFLVSLVGIGLVTALVGAAEHWVGRRRQDV